LALLSRRKIRSCDAASSGRSENEAIKRRDQTGSSPFKNIWEVKAEETTDAQYRARVKADEAALAKKQEDDLRRKQWRKKRDAEIKTEIAANSKRSERRRRGGRKRAR